MRHRCLCHCHNPPDADWHQHGVDVADVLEAAVACPVCLNSHSPALLSRKRAPIISDEPATPAEPDEDDQWRKRGWR